jgi:hypothetical protein
MGHQQGPNAEMKALAAAIGARHRDLHLFQARLMQRQTALDVLAKGLSVVFTAEAEGDKILEPE